MLETIGSGRRKNQGDCRDERCPTAQPKHRTQPIAGDGEELLYQRQRQQQSAGYQQHINQRAQKRKCALQIETVILEWTTQGSIGHCDELLEKRATDSILSYLFSSQFAEAYRLESAGFECDSP